MSEQFRTSLTVLTPLAVLVLLASWLASRLEPWPTTAQSKPSRQAQEDPFLAARRLLEELGSEVQVIRDFRDRQLPPTDVTIFIAGPHFSLGRRQIRELADWVKRGGHLAVAVDVRDRPPPFLAGDEVADDDGEQVDPLLLELGIQSGSAGFEGPLRVNGSALRQDEEIVVLEPPPTGGLSVLDFDATPAELWIGTDERLAVVRAQLGQGTVTAWTSELWLTNGNLRRGDNGLLLWELARRRVNPLIWLVPRLEPPRLTALVWRHGWPAVVSLVALLIAGLAASARRLGPLAPEPSPSRRSLEEHLLACGRLLSSSGATESLLAACRRALEQRAMRRAPNWERLSSAERQEHLARLAGVARETIAAALAADGDGRGASFAAKVRQLEMLRRSL